LGSNHLRINRKWLPKKKGTQWIFVHRPWNHLFVCNTTTLIWLHTYRDCYCYFFFRYMFNILISDAILHTLFCVKSRRRRRLYYIVLAVQVLCAQRPKEKHNNFLRRLSPGLLYVIVEAEVSACTSVWVRACVQII